MTIGKRTLKYEKEGRQRIKAALESTSHRLAVRRAKRARDRSSSDDEANMYRPRQNLKDLVDAAGSPGKGLHGAAGERRLFPRNRVEIRLGAETKRIVDEGIAALAQ